jgi:hypothetical protein
MPRLFQRLYIFLVEPKSNDDDGRRREFILNVILSGSFALSVVALLIVGINTIRLADRYHGEPPEAALLTVLFFLSLWVVSRKISYAISAYALTLLFLVLSLYPGSGNGVDLIGN